MDTLTLWQLQPNKSAEIIAWDDRVPFSYTQRIQELGFVVGEQVRCIRTSLFGGPRVYQVGGSVYSLEKAIANGIRVKAQ